VYRNGIPVIQISNPPPELVQLRKEQVDRKARFGQIRPAIHADWRGKKWVAVGKQIVDSPNWKTPIDFLSDFIKHVLTPSWGKAELAKPLTERHPVMQWYDAVCRLSALHEVNRNAEGLIGMVPSGAMRAYFLLAYDLYILQHHGFLEEGLLQRLRHKDQYQGARHELFAAATCVRAGFDIEYEDESDGASRHTEFTAVNRQSGRRLSVEAKSKHRSGVLGMTGDREPDESVRTRLGRLINDALKKPRKHLFAIFLDLNLPPASPAHGTPQWFTMFADPILRSIDRKGEEDPWDLLVFSNQPDHYATDDAPGPGGYALGMFGKNGRIGARPPSELTGLIDAANKFGTIPNRFEEM
jgi:hypothetical protein